MRQTGGVLEEAERGRSLFPAASLIQADLLVVKEVVPTDLIASLEHCRPFEQRHTVTAAIVADWVEQTLRTQPTPQFANELLVESIVGQTHYFMEWAGATSVIMRLELITRQMCPKFHIDNTYWRQIITYFGPGTEYIDEAQPEVIHQSPPGSVVLMKGEQHPTCRHTMLHRSPALANGQRRFCLVLDVPKAPSATVCP